MDPVLVFSIVAVAAPTEADSPSPVLHGVMGLCVCHHRRARA